ncbi:MAG: polysaccharide biosynthesis/export family protein, partial [Saprospiraceae bacterium]|nr:polysaccharide biosynthesis/export family protein [Saprospiraceae bacterium]
MLEKMRLFLSICLAIVLSGTGMHAQNTNPEIEQQARAAIQARGLDETEVRARLQSEGIDIDNVRPEQLSSLQPTIERVLNEMEAEKQENAANPGSNNGTTRPTRPFSASQQPSDSIRVEEVLGDTMKDRMAIRRTIPRDSQNILPTGIYGHQLFRQKEGSIFKIATDVKPPDSYILSSGDELTVSIFGPSQFDNKFTINKEGYISPSGMPKIFLKGIR